MFEQKFGIEIQPMWREKPDSSPQSFVADVRSELVRILSSRAGQAIASSLRFHGKTILLMPYEGQDCNSQTANVSSISPQVVVLYSPRLLRGSPCSKKKSSENNANLPHEILFHELVHALRRVTGHNHPHQQTGRLMGYKDSEEFLAILATNIFISDTSNPFKSGLRANHESHLSLEKELADSFLFFRNGTRAFNIIATFCDENCGFAGLLSKVRARFNPIAAYLTNSQRALHMAAEGDADVTFTNLIPMTAYQEPSGIWTRFSRPVPPAKPGR